MSDLPNGWRQSTVGEAVVILDSRRIPLTRVSALHEKDPFHITELTAKSGQSTITFSRVITSCLLRMVAILTIPTGQMRMRSQAGSGSIIMHTS